MDAKGKHSTVSYYFTFTVFVESLLQVLVLNEKQSLRQGLMKPMLTSNSLCICNNLDLLLFQPLPSDYREYRHSPCCIRFRQ